MKLKKLSKALVARLYAKGFFGQKYMRRKRMRRMNLGNLRRRKSQMNQRKRRRRMNQ
jgi:hypothetical protein